MPRFYFDTHDGASLARDTEGLELPDREAAQRQSHIELAYMAKYKTPDHDGCSLYVNVFNEDRVPIYTVCMAITGRWLG